MAVQRAGMILNARYRGIGMTSQRTRERLVARLRSQGINDPRVLEVMRHTPRHIFVEEALASHAYEDIALPIGYSQTISQPYTVARMTEALLNGVTPRSVLEVGTGSGYQTAVLAQLVRRVFSVERIQALLEGARGRIHDLKLDNVCFKHTDGSCGWREYAPYDAILVAAAAPEVPPALVEQLSTSGCLVMPVGGPGEQTLIRVIHTRTGFEQLILERVSFVPLRRGES
jgi:protein-L-isoaspartate(D-aspartate) O-methyltransferase